MQTVYVPLGTRAYEVRIAPDLIMDAGKHIAPFLSRPRVAIVTDEHVAQAHLAALTAGLQSSGIAHSTLTLPAGESTKAWPEFSRTVEWLLAE